jgi:phage terminase large subunit
MNILENKSDQELVIELPKKFHFLLKEPARFKVLYGGRGAGKTETIARALIILASQKRLRIGCFRDIQNSIDESVYSTIQYCIHELNLSDEFLIQNNSIVSLRTGSEFIFSGLRYKIQAIKSMARIDIAWLEEARDSSKNTLEKLFPTIRGQYKDGETKGGPFGKGPEIWISFNPELDTDPVYEMFVKTRKYTPDYVQNEETGQKERYCVVVKVNYYDNPFFPEDLRQQMQVMRDADKDNEDDDESDYLHVWEGHTIQVLKGAIYAKEIKKILKDGRRGKVPYNPNKPVFVFFDLGHSDKTAIWFIQQAGVEFNVIDYYENRLEKMPHYIKYMQDKPYVYSKIVLPHDGDAETLSNVTPKKQLQNAFPNAHVRIVQRPSKKSVGINAARTVLDLCNFDEENTSDGWQCLCNYAYKINKDNGAFSKEPDHDTPWSHGADSFQTFALSLKPEQEINKKDKPTERTVGSGKVVNFHRNGNSWMGA